MGRFENLEFEGHEPLREDALEREAEGRDEGYYLKLADDRFRSGRFEPALRYYSRTLEFNPNLVDGWFGQVRMLIELGEFKEARLWADKALEIFADHPDLLAGKAVATVRLGMQDLALGFSDAALQKKGGSVYVWIARGEVMTACGQDTASHCFLKAETLAAGEWFVLLDIARICLFYKRYANGLQYAERSALSRKDSAFAWHVVGRCRLGLGLDETAERAFREAAALDPDFKAAKEALARLESRGPLDLLAGTVRGWFRGKGR